MTVPAHLSPLLTTQLSGCAAWFAAGLLGGAACWAGLQAQVRRWVAAALRAGCGADRHTAGSGWVMAQLLLGQLLRVGLLAVLLLAAVRFGAGALLACAAGVLAARGLWRCRARRDAARARAAAATPERAAGRCARVAP